MFNGSGVFQRLYSWTNDALASIKIRADRMDNEMHGMATGLSTCITKDGQTTITANLPMTNFKHTAVGVASNRTDYARTDQLSDGVVNWVVAGGTADALTATFTLPTTVLKDGQLFNIRASLANTTSTPTFAPDGLTARTIVADGGGALAASDIKALGEVILRYNLANTRYEYVNRVGLADGSVTAAKLATDSVTTVKILNGNVTTAKLADNAVNTDKVFRNATLVDSGSGVLSTTLSTEGTIASAATTNLGSVTTTNIISITGTTGITALGSSAVVASPLYFVRFTGALLLTHNGTSLILPSAANITTVAGDTAVMKYEGSGNWRCMNYSRASGAALVVAGGGAGLTVIGTSTPTGVASVTFSSIPQTYRGLYLVFNGLSCDTASRNLIIRNDVGAGVANSNINAKKITGTTVTAVSGTGDLLAVSTTLTAAQTASGFVSFLPYQAITITPAKLPLRKFSAYYNDTVGNTATIEGGQETEGASDVGVTTLTLVWNGAGNFDAGTVTLYGIN